MTDPDPQADGSTRPVGLFGATMVGVGAMVGAGIFVLCGVAIENAGPAAILAFLLNGFLSLLTAFSFAELASAFPESGGGYVFAKKVFPIGGAFTAGWVLWFAYVVAAALYALGFASFLGYAITSVSGAELAPWFGPAVGLATLVAAVWILLRRGASAGNWVSFAKVVAFLILIVLGLVALAGRPAGTLRESFSPMLPFGVGGVIVAMGYTYIALEGFEVIAAIGEEVKNPSRTIPRAMFLSIGITLVVYTGLMFVVLTAGGTPGSGPAWRSLVQEGDAAMTTAAGNYAGTPGGVIVVVAGLLATFSAMAAAILAASRVAFAMARDRALPRVLSRLRGPRQAPVAALVASGGIAAIVVLVTADVEVSGAAASLVFLISFALANGAGLLVRIRVGAPSGFRAPLYPALPLLGITSCLGLAVFQAVAVPQASVVVLVWLLVGGILYRRSFGPRARTVSARSEAQDSRLVRLRGRRPLVLVPIANPERAVPLIRFAHLLAVPDVGRVVAVTVGRHDPVTRDVEGGAAAYARAERVLGEAARAACGLGKAFEAEVILSPDVTSAIVRVAAERHSETVLLGMSDMTDPTGVAVLEGVLAGTTSDVVVLNAPPDWTTDGVRRVLVPVAGKAPHDPLRARLLGALLRAGRREATLLRVLRPGEDAAYAERELLRRAEDLGLGPESCVLEPSLRPADVIVEHSADADLLVLGFGQGARRRRLIGPFVLSVVTAAHCPVVAITEAAASGLGLTGRRSSGG